VRQDGVHYLTSHFNQGTFVINGFSHEHGITHHFLVTFFSIHWLSQVLIPVQGCGCILPLRGSWQTVNTALSKCLTAQREKVSYTGLHILQLIYLHLFKPRHTLNAYYIHTGNCFPDCTMH